ncbi:hypothetical protein [Lichenicoccus roseus]|nr:hypothetical protein [Lichenicoccus roseus]
MSDTTSTPEPATPGPDPIDEDEKVDVGVDDTFPASDPPSIGGSTGPNDP